jgi:hypothetical protein
MMIHWLNQCSSILQQKRSFVDFDGVRLRLSAAATNGHIVHIPDNI